MSLKHYLISAGFESKRALIRAAYEFILSTAYSIILLLRTGPPQTPPPELNETETGFEAKLFFIDGETTK
jgi:hypothetical protein